MQTQTTEPTRPKESLTDLLKRLYARNHRGEYNLDKEKIGNFPVFAKEFVRTREYLKQNPVDVKMHVYYAHLLSEVGAGPLVVEEAVGLSFLPEPIDPFLLYSVKIALKRTGQTKAIEQYEPFQSEQVVKYETEPGPDGQKITKLPKKHWWSKQEYEVKVVHSRTATYGEIKFLGAQLGQEYN